MKRIGVFGGTFDPPHVAHLVLAECARDALDLDRVLWLPAAHQPLKPRDDVSAITHRLDMVELVVKPDPGFELSRVDVERPGPHYTVDTLQILQERYPDAVIYLIVGSDSLNDLPRWHDPQRLVENACFAVVERPGSAIDLSAYQVDFPGIKSSITTVDAPLMQISSTLIRHRVSVGRSVRYLVPSPVESYIRQHGLYCN